LNRWVLDRYDQLRHPAAFTLATPGPGRSPTDRSGLRGHRYALLVTFRRDGTAVPSPVWFALDGDVVFVRTDAASWKVKRIRRNPSVLIAPSTTRGKPLGDVVAAQARVLSPDEHQPAVEVCRAAYGLSGRIYDSTVGRLHGEVAFVEITPAREGT
jgi:uncharacterized protein